MLDYIKRHEFVELGEKVERLAKACRNLKGTQETHKDKLEMLKRKAERHLKIHRQEKCKHEHRVFSQYPPNYSHAQTLCIEICADCKKELSSKYYKDDTEWLKRKLNYEKEIHRKKLIAVREQIKILEEEKEK